MKTKICSKCKKELPATNQWYYSDKSHSDSFRSACKNCIKKPRKAHNKVCKMCKSKYIAQRQDSNFCSISCKNKYYHIFNRCSWYLCKCCGSMFPSRKKSDIVGKKFCSINCKRKYFNRHIYKKQFVYNQYSHNRIKILMRLKKDVENLTDSYVVSLLTSHNSGLTRRDIREIPKLIELKRLTISIKRLQTKLKTQ